MGAGKECVTDGTVMLAMSRWPPPGENWRRAHDVQAALWRGRHIRAAGLPDLLIGAVAERERVTILHHDGDDDPITHVKARCASMADTIRHYAEPDGRVIFDH